jgi:type IV pilus assembly protein PilQ
MRCARVVAVVTLGLALVAGAAAAGSTEAAAGREQDEARITLDVREVDITDVVRVLAEVGNFQVVLDPGVSCKVTLKLKEVLWPAVLDVALRSCGLAKEDDIGIVRIATAAKLTQEASDRARLEEAKRLAAPTRVTTMRLSYARASELAPVIKKMLSPRGDVIWDTRTNTLIIID